MLDSLKVTEVRIEVIKPYDTVVHNNEVKTVTKKDIKYNKFIGFTLFGDSYNLGMRKVKLVRFN